MQGTETAKLAAAILAGGRASRFGGRAKGLLEVGGTTILERLLGEIHGAGIDEIIVASNDRGAYDSCGVPVVPDARRGIGPLGGVETALAFYANARDGVLFLPCDLPAITSREIRALTSAFVSASARIVVAQTGGFFWQPLCSVVHSDLKAAVTAAIDEGERKPRYLWWKLGAMPVGFEDSEPFFNINTPEDLALWRGSERPVRVALGVPTAMLDSLQAFVAKKDIPVELTTAGECAARIVGESERVADGPDVLHVGGTIRCADARAMAARLGISTGKMGRLLNFLNMKIRQCDLGLF